MACCNPIASSFQRVYDTGRSIHGSINNTNNNQQQTKSTIARSDRNSNHVLSDWAKMVLLILLLPLLLAVIPKEHHDRDRRRKPLPAMISIEHHDSSMRRPFIPIEHGRQSLISIEHQPHYIESVTIEHWLNETTTTTTTTTRMIIVLTTENNKKRWECDKRWAVLHLFFPLIKWPRLLDLTSMQYSDRTLQNHLGEGFRKYLCNLRVLRHFL